MIRSAKALLLAVSLGGLLLGQAPGETPKPDNKAGAYYNFAMGRVYAELAQAYGNKPDYLNKAIQHYQEALKLDPSASLVFEELTDLYIQTNHLRDAITLAEEMLKQSPDNVDARRMLGRIYMKMISTADNRINEDYLRKAIEQLQKVTEKEPKDAESWVALGRLYRVSNNSVDAEKAYNKALEAEADNEEALTGLAMLYSDLGDNKRAIEKLKLATEKNPNERTLIALGTAYEQLRDYKNAADTLKKALEMQPDNTRLQAGLANNLMLSDRVEEALSIFEKLSSDEPTNVQPKLRIAEIYRVKHDYVKAAEALKKAKALNPQDMEVRYEEVRLLEAQSKYTEAISHAEGAGRRDGASQVLRVRRRSAGSTAGGTGEPLSHHRAVQRVGGCLPQGFHVEQGKQRCHLAPDHRHVSGGEESRGRAQGSGCRGSRTAHPHERQGRRPCTPDAGFGI